MTFFNWLGSKIKDATQFIGGKIKDGAQWIGSKMPIISTIANGVKQIADFAKPIAGAFGFGTVADVISSGAGWVADNTGNIKNGLEKAEKVGNTLIDVSKKLPSNRR